MRRLWKRLGGLCLALALLAGILAVPAQAANTAAASLLKNVYYGTYTNCAMTYDMATAYAGVLAKQGSGTKAILADPAGDGMPLLLTGTEGSFPTVWTFDGTKATAYDFTADSETGCLTDFLFGKSNDSVVLCVGDGSLQDMTGASGFTHYRVKNGQLTYVTHKMLYSAYSVDGVTVEGQLLPLVKGATAFQSGGLTYYKATVTALLQAGWKEDSSNKNIYCLGKTGDQYIYFDSYSKGLVWRESTDGHVNLSSQVIDVYTGLLEGNWTTASSLKTLLTNYAAAVDQGGQYLDVGKSHYAYNAVQWAVEQGITKGTSDTSFSPNMTCTNAHILTFLHRSQGSPEPEWTVNLYDAVPDDYYFCATYWAAEQGLISGSRCYPRENCTRAQVVTYLWKLAGSPTVTGTASFTDVPSSASYYQAVQWAVQQGITNGTSDTTFSPSATCTRAQIVTFLYRAFA